MKWQGLGDRFNNLGIERPKPKDAALPSDFNRAGRRAYGFRGRLYGKQPEHLTRYVRRHLAMVASLTRRPNRRQRKIVARIGREVARHGA